MVFKKKPKLKHSLPGRAELKAVLERINEHYSITDDDGNKENILVTADKAPDLLRIPTGTLGGDYATGGGWPARRVSLIYGWESSGKTTLTCAAVKQAQRLCPICYYVACDCNLRELMGIIVIDPEGKWNTRMARRIGVNLDQVHLCRPDYAEQGIDVTDTLLRSGACGLVVVDSVACLTPSGELAESAEKWQQGLQARLINKALRKWVTALNLGGVSRAHGPSLLLINQIRMNIGVMFANPEVMPGGNAQKFAASIRCKTMCAKKGKDPSDNSTQFIEVKVKADKNHTYPPDRMGIFKLWVTNRSKRHFLGEIEDTPLIMEMAQANNIIQVAKKKYYWPGKNEKGLDLKGFLKALNNRILGKGLKGPPVTQLELLRSEVLQAMMGEDTDQVVRLINPEARDRVRKANKNNLLIE